MLAEPGNGMGSAVLEGGRCTVLAIAIERGQRQAEQHGVAAELAKIASCLGMQHRFLHGPVTTENVLDLVGLDLLVFIAGAQALQAGHDAKRSQGDRWATGSEVTRDVRGEIE